jgi:HlyD family secretion protein
MTERLVEAEAQLRGERELRQQGFSTNQRLWERLSVVDQLRNELADLRQSLLEHELSRFSSSTNDAKQIEAARRQFTEAERRVATLQARLTRESVIRAQADGRVTELQAVPGEPIDTGRPVISFESIGRGLDLVLYLPSRQGKSVEPGMRVQISPTTAQREEYGTIFGTIATVSEFPATTDGMMAVLRNRELVRQFSVTGPPYRAIVHLDRDPDSANGFRWSSERGRLLELSSGTLAKAEVTVRSQRPIELVLPLLREWSGI